MPNLDRDSFIALLNRLGDPDEAEALATAREIDRRVRECGLTWSELLAPQSSSTSSAGIAANVEDGDDTALIDELLTNQDLTPETRQELLDFKSDIAEGEFTSMDAKYLRDLHARLNRRQDHSAGTIP